MKLKLYYGLIVVLITFLGKLFETPVTANQQIIVQFSNTTITTTDAKAAITSIESKLRQAGVEHIRIGENQNGELRITYFSKTEVTQIQNILLGEKQLQVGVANSGGESSDNSKSQYLKDYKFNVSEIQKSSHPVNWDLEGTEVVEIPVKADRFNNLNSNSYGCIDRSELIRQLSSLSSIIESSNNKLDNSYSYKFPEVRAGPLV